MIDIDNGNYTEIDNQNHEVDEQVDDEQDEEEQDEEEQDKEEQYDDELTKKKMPLCWYNSVQTTYKKNNIINNKPDPYLTFGNPFIKKKI
jgi:hypothetical protein